MNKKTIWFTFPTLLLPYIYVACLAIIFWGHEIIAKVFHHDGFLFLGVLLLYMLLTLVTNIILCTIMIVKRWDEVTIAKTSMIIKIIHIPAYIAIFCLGVILLCTIFTLPFSIALAILSYFSLCMTSIIGTTAILNAYRNNLFDLKTSIIFGFLQFVFCLDVFISIVYYILLKKEIIKQKTNQQIQS